MAVRSVESDFRSTCRGGQRTHVLPPQCAPAQSRCLPGRPEHI